MAAQAYIFRTYVNGEPALPTSTGMEPIFKSISVSTNGSDQGMKIFSTGTKFDFNGKILADIVAGGATGEAVEYTQFLTALALYIPLAQKGAANGVATLDGASKIPVAQMPVGEMQYKGTWNAATNTPALANGTGINGQVYAVKHGSADVNLGPWYLNAPAAVSNGSAVVTVTEVAHGLTSSDKVTVTTVATIGGIVGADLSQTAAQVTIIDADTFSYVAAAAATSDDTGTLDSVAVLQTFMVGDWVIYDGAVWEQVGNSLSVISVNGFTGVVVLTTSDIAEGSNLYFTTARARTAAVADAIVDGVTDVAPSQNAVFDALALKADKSDDYATMQNGQGGAVAITIRQFVYTSAAGVVKKADASIAFTAGTWIGCVRDASIADTASGTVWRPRRGTVIPGFTALTVNVGVWLSHNTPGGYTQDATTLVAGDRVVFLGYPESATTLVFDPEYQGQLS